MTAKRVGQLPDADELQARTSVQQLLARFGMTVPEQTTGQLRIACLFSDTCHTSGYGNLVINLDHPQKLFRCHACGREGNLLTLAYWLETGEYPQVKLRREKFRQALGVLLALHGQPDVPPEEPASTAGHDPREAGQPEQPQRNLPLIESEREAVRATAELHLTGTFDPAEMPPEAAAIVRRRRHFLTEEVCRKWQYAYLPRSTRSLFRGQFVIPVRDDAGRILTWAARDPLFERKLRKWEANGRPEGEQPNKVRFVKGFAKGLETFGQNAKLRIADNPRLGQSLEQLGLVLVEGFHDVIRLDCLGVYAEGLMGTRITAEQIARVVKRAQELGRGRIVVMPDNDEPGHTGAAETVAALARHCDVRIADYEASEPEWITNERWADIRQSLKRPV